MADLAAFNEALNCNAAVVTILVWGKGESFNVYEDATAEGEVT